MAQIQPLPEPQLETGKLNALEAGGFIGSKWSFVYLARSHGGQAAKDAFLAAVSTVGVINALLLSFAVPQLGSPPATLMDGEHDDTARVWFWLTFMSVVMSISSVLLATILLTYCTVVPEEGIAAYLVTVHLSYSLMALSFIFAVLLQGGAQLATVNSYVSDSDFWAALAVLLGVYSCIFAYFVYVDGRSGATNKALYEQLMEQRRAEAKGACGEDG